MKINVIKASSSENILFLYPSKTHKFRSQLDKIGWFPSQELININ